MLAVFARHGLEREVCRPPRRPPSPSRRRSGIAREPLDRVREGVVPVHRDDQAVLLVPHHLRDPADRRHHDREAARHGPEDGERQPLVARGQREEVGGDEQIGHVLAEAEEARLGAVDPELPREPMDEIALVAVADDA